MFFLSQCRQSSIDVFQENLKIIDWSWLMSNPYPNQSFIKRTQFSYDSCRLELLRLLLHLLKRSKNETDEHGLLIISELTSENHCFSFSCGHRYLRAPIGLETLNCRSWNSWENSSYEIGCISQKALAQPTGRRSMLPACGRDQREGILLCSSIVVQVA